MKEHNTGCYICKKCKVHIKVLSKQHHSGWIYPKIITNCPQCGSNVTMINISVFKDLEHDVWINVTKNQIKYSLKFPVKLLEKVSSKEV